ncbi:MAG: beta-N-acetylhexosaminidase [Ruminococcaceae bacterium]|nr:beta-N-acetylhexosaminidase [Oscillospiraceae bacterium]
MAKMKFEKFGVMIDLSRNSVMTVEAMKRYMDALAKMGYNCVFLYTEDTYEADGEPYFGYMRGKYTKDEMKELDAYGASVGIEVIPCIQTLAHLATHMRWSKIPGDTPDIILVGDERTYEFIDHLFATLSECFTTRRLHIGMDEAHMLGKGLYLARNGYEDPHAIIRKHLDRIMEIAAKYNFELMLWSDMFFRPWNQDNYYIPKCEVPKEYVEALPKSVIPVFWDYYHTSFETYDNMMYNHKQLSKDFWFAGGAWTWTGYMPHNDYTLETMLPALEAAKKNKTKNVFFTMWGDDGGECSRWGVLPSLFYLAEVAKGNTDEEKIKKKFKQKFGIAYEDFMLLDKLDHIVGAGEGASPRPNPSKYALVADTFHGWLDYTIEPNAAHRYEALSEQLAAVAKKSRRYAPLFNEAAKLASVLAVKYDLGLRVRAAYKAGDKEMLAKIAKEDYPLAIRRLDIFVAAMEKQWLSENKRFGLEVQHIRFGGVKARLEFCRKSLLSYLAGELASIPELEEEILPIAKKEKSTNYNSAIKTMTVGQIW